MHNLLKRILSSFYYYSLMD